MNFHANIPTHILDERIESGRRAEELERDIAERESAPKPVLTPVTTEDRSGNELRPVTFDDIVGQESVKRLLRRMVQATQARNRPMDHVLMVGPSGTGKTTFAHVIAHELGARVFQLEAPVSADTLQELAATMEDGDILFLDEIHQQSLGDRRGRSSSTQPEVLFSVMEDFTLPTASGVMQFPRVTIMGATTDEGMLPDAFINRFPIRPRLEPYGEADMAIIARHNAEALKLGLTPSAARRFARASRGVPREVNNFVRNAAMLTDFRVSDELAFEVVHDLNGVAEDGLTRDMQEMLKFLYTRARRITGAGETRYQASISSIATAIGKSRDQKAVQLRIEPYLIEQGFIQVAHGGRILTDAGIRRAIELLQEN
jgi:Holliday junction DNA helicase RuvB